MQDIQDVMMSAMLKMNQTPFKFLFLLMDKL